MATSVPPTPSAAPAVERNFSATIAKVSQQTGIPADPVAPNLTLINTLAQERAKQLMMESNDYF